LVGRVCHSMDRRTRDRWAALSAAECLQGAAMICPLCRCEMSDHPALPIARCLNARCLSFDMWHTEKQAARVAPANAILPIAQPPASHPGTEGSEVGR
jgi:hypothetical protein